MRRTGESHMTATRHTPAYIHRLVVLLIGFLFSSPRPTQSQLTPADESATSDPESEQWIPRSSFSCNSDEGDVVGRRTYIHPLLNAPRLSNGKIAVVDTVEVDGNNDALRYAVVHRTSVPQVGDEVLVASGVEELRRRRRRRKLSNENRMTSEHAHPGKRTHENAPRRFPSASAHHGRNPGMREGNGRNALRYTIALRRPNGPTLTDALRRAIASGQIETVNDLHATASIFRSRRITEISRAVDSVANEVIRLGGTVGYRCRNTYCLSARLPPPMAERIASLPAVQRMSEVELLNPESGIWDAEDRSEVMQINQFLADDYDGEQESGTFRDDIWFAVIESRTYDDEHKAWGKSGENWSRIASRFTCNDGTGCVYHTNFATPDEPESALQKVKVRHPTQVAALIFANLMEGQDPELDDPERHSGFARNALGRLFHAEDGDTASWDEIIDTIRGYAGPYEHVVNLSQGGTIACNGQETAAISANALYEDGTLLIKSAGNKSFNSIEPSKCTATTPGAAIGCFTVGGIRSSSGIENMRKADIWYTHSASGSSTGGSEGDLPNGRGRTIIDITAHAYLKYVPMSNSGYGSIVTGTSFAAPQVTGAAINFIDYFQDKHFNLEYEPGFLYANLLLMGDREACIDDEPICGTNKLASRFDRRFGAGRAKFRRFDAKGLDAPAHYGTGFIPCLGHGETVTLPIPLNNTFAAMEVDVDDFKFVAWWYDRRHELSESGTVANIDLRLYHVNEGGNDLGTLVESNDLYDNKERVYYDQPGGKRLVVEFIGTNMFPDDESWVQGSCGAAGEVDVYFAYLAEDRERNDPDGPHWNDIDFTGVEPESWIWP